MAAKSTAPMGQIVSVSDVRKPKRGRKAVLDQRLVPLVALLDLSTDQQALLLDKFPPLLITATDKESQQYKDQNKARQAFSTEIKKAWYDVHYNHGGVKAAVGEYRPSINYDVDGFASVSRAKLPEAAPAVETVEA